MSDTTDAPVVPEAPKPAAPAPAAPAAESNELPDWARKQISDANTEAANYRVQLKAEKQAAKELRDQMAEMANQHASSASTQASIQSDFDRLVTAIQAEVPHEHIFSFAKTLQGSNEDELKTHATELKSMFGISSGPARAVDRSQGQGGSGVDNSPAAEFARLLQAQLTR
jgi:hypothetical protein